MFTSTGTLSPNMLGRIYSFLDWDGWSGERVVLRPDGTIPAARLYVENLSHVRPAKLFYVENVFSYEETGKESRERWQCGAEIIGSDRPTADVELILLAHEVLRKLDIEGIQVHLSHAGVIRAVLGELGLTPAEQGEVFHRMLDGDTEVFGKIVDANPRFRDAISLLFEVKGKSAGHLQNLKASLAKAFLSPALKASMEDFISIAQCLSEMGCEYQIDISSGRNFEYYTGIIFRFYLEGERVAGGGRYNDLIALLGGGESSASGFSLSIDRLMNLNKGWQESAPEVLVRSEVNTASGQKRCYEIASLLRSAGYVAEIDQGYGGATEHRWILSILVDKAKPAFLLTDQVDGKSIEVDSSSEILGMIQAKDANKASSSKG